MKRFILTFMLCFFVLFTVLNRRAHATDVSLGRFIDPALVGVNEDEKPLTRWFNRYFNPEPEEDRPSEVGWFVGPMLMLLNYDVDMFAPMTTDRGLGAFEDETFVWGIKGGFIRRSWRIGGMFLEGGMERRDRVNGQKRSAQIDFYGGGLFFEYNREYRSREELKYPVRIPFLREGYLVGCMVGMGRISLDAKGQDLGPESLWEVKEALLVAYPYAGIWASPYDWLWMQIDLGYLYFNLDTDDSKYVNAGTRMVSKDFTGGVQLGVKITFGDNPNFP